MVRTGSQLITFRGPGPWRGKTSKTVADRGDSRLIQIENGYVSSDGSEIRTFPGWKCVVDLVSTALTAGYSKTVVDASRPVSAADGNYQGEATASEFMYAYAPVKNIHCMEFVRGKLLIVGESTHRREHIYNTLSPAFPCTPIGWEPIAGSPATTRIFLDFAPRTTGFNGIDPGNVVFIENMAQLTGSAADKTALNNKFHYVSAVGVGTVASIDIVTETSASGTCTGNIARTRGNLERQLPCHRRRGGPTR